MTMRYVSWILVWSALVVRPFAFCSTPCKRRQTFLASSPVEELPSLYKEQEKLLVDRGKVEAALMKDTLVSIEPNVVKGSGSGGGFGGGSKSGGTQQFKAQSKAHASVLRKRGVVRIDNVLSKELADEMRSYVYKRRKESEELIEAGEIKPIERFANVLLKENRCDMPVPVGPELVAAALHCILQKSPVGKTIAALLGKDAVLYELSCLMSDPGSDRQVMHPDTPCGATDEEAVLYTCFVALQDIKIDMGPTTWLPDTHTKEIHEAFRDEIKYNGEESRKDKLLRTQPGVLGLLPKGSCAIYDSRLLHCGGANESETSRALFYFSFKNPKVGYPGNPGSIQKDMIDVWSLRDLDKELTLYGKGKPSERLVNSS